MLLEAKKKGIYDELIKQDILGYLASADLNFDYFIATDVFIYVGDLSDVFHNKISQQKSGKLVFSTEHYNGDDYSLQQSGRYSHSKIYIESLCETFGYKLRHFENKALRKEKKTRYKRRFIFIRFLKIHLVLITSDCLLTPTACVTTYNPQTRHPKSSSRAVNACR